MSDFLGIDVTGLDEIKSKMAKLGSEAADAGTEEVGSYLIDVLRANAPRKSITRKEAYGKTFFSDKQRRFFFAALRDGRIRVPYTRTQALSRGWRKIGTGARQIIVNETPGAKFVRGDYPGEQSRHENMVGWVPVKNEIKNRMSTMLKRFEGAVDKVIKKLGLS